MNNNQSGETMNPVKSIRARYIIGLSTLALVIVVTQLLVQKTIESQKNNGHVINIAGNQVGLANRIAFFVSQMSASTNEDDFNTARQQVGRAISLMQKEKESLINGAPKQGIPRIMTPQLKTIYYDPDFGLDGAYTRFLKNATAVYESQYGDLTSNSGAYVFVINYGPYVLGTLLEAAVGEYEAYNSNEIRKLQNYEHVALFLAIVVILIEAIFIFRPLELRVHRAFQQLRTHQDKLNREIQRAEQANRSKTDFLMNMSHELRTPLNAIIGFAECLKKGIYGPLATNQQTERINDIHQSGDHLLKLVNDILDISAAETGTITLNESTTSLHNLIASSVSVINTIAKEAGVALQPDYEPADIIVRADERRIGQVLINLLTNAVKFTPPGGRIRIAKLRHPDGRAGFAITDTGVGMTSKEIETARERFGQVVDVLVRNHDGAGLGLPLAIELIACHEGTVSISSQKGIGTTVSVLFPSDRILPLKKINSFIAA